jgi:hypothetical protein
MDIGQAVKRLKSGDQVRRREWDEGRVLDLEGEEGLNLTYEDLLADDWEIVDG